MKHLWSRAAGMELGSDQIAALHRYATWLRDEAIPAGGLGGEETERIDDRHIADSLLFSGQIGNPDQIWDLGSGVGLPGIPLAVVFPHTRFSLVDRSGRRVDLLKRASRVLGLDNVVVHLQDIETVEGPCAVVVSRASMPPARLTPVIQRILAPEGVAVIGGSWVEAPHVESWETKEVGREVLDRDVWLLIMRRQ